MSLPLAKEAVGRPKVRSKVESKGRKLSSIGVSSLYVLTLVSSHKGPTSVLALDLRLRSVGYPRHYETIRSCLEGLERGKLVERGKTGRFLCTDRGLKLVSETFGRLSNCLKGWE